MILSKQGSSHCNNGWQAVEATALAAVTAAPATKHEGPGVAVTGQGVGTGECCCPHMERVTTLEALCGISSLDVMDDDYVHT